MKECCVLHFVFFLIFIIHNLSNAYLFHMAQDRNVHVTRVLPGGLLITNL